jgi:hypothetical protein
MFSSVFQEGLTQSAKLPENDPDTFDLFIDWLYQARISILPAEKKDEVQAATRAMIKFHIFAEK